MLLGLGLWVFGCFETLGVELKMKMEEIKINNYILIHEQWLSRSTAQPKNA